VGNEQGLIKVADNKKRAILESAQTGHFRFTSGADCPVRIANKPSIKHRFNPIEMGT